MLCKKCNNIFYQQDVNMCPFCGSEVSDEESDAESDTIVDSLEKEWGLPQDLLQEIVLKDQHKLLDQFMMITDDGEVFPADDEEDLRKIIFEYINDEGCIDDIEYCFVDGEGKHLDIDIKFVNMDNPEKRKNKFAYTHSSYPFLDNECENEEELKKDVMLFILEPANSLSDIEDIIVDHETKKLEIDISFI